MSEEKLYPIFEHQRLTPEQVDILLEQGVTGYLFPDGRKGRIWKQSNHKPIRGYIAMSLEWYPQIKRFGWVAVMSEDWRPIDTHPND